MIALLFVISTLLLISDLSMTRATFYRKFITLHWLAHVEMFNSNQLLLSVLTIMIQRVEAAYILFWDYYLLHFDVPQCYTEETNWAICEYNRLQQHEAQFVSSESRSLLQNWCSLLHSYLLIRSITVTPGQRSSAHELHVIWNTFWSTSCSYHLYFTMHRSPPLT